MKLSNLNSLVTIKRAKSNNTNKSSSAVPRSKAPRSILAEVLFSRGSWLAIIENNRYPLEITEDDYKEAHYIFSSPHNDKWYPYTLKSYKYDKDKYESIKDFWWIIDPLVKQYIYIENNVAKLDMVKINNRNYRRYAKLKSDYYANRCR